jgi:hypothetical protein
MQTRKTPRNIPDKPHYLTIELSDMGTTNWRIPSMPKIARILRLLQSSGVMDAAANAENGDDIVANLGENLPALFSCQGALIGVCWYDQNQDLETAPARAGSDLFTYGEQIYEELHESGWQMGHINTCFMKLTETVIASFISQKEIADRVDFLAPATDVTN